MKIIESYSEAKSVITPSEDLAVVSTHFVAVIDGATPKNSYSYNDESPGHLAARVIGETIIELDSTLPESANLEAKEIVERLNNAIARHIQEGLTKDSYPTASIALYNINKREVILVGDCIFATKSKDGVLECYTNGKLIDKVLSDWRSDIVKSLLSRAILTKEDIARKDHGREIIQPFITSQVAFQNIIGHRYSFGAIDGTHTPDEFIKVYKIDEDIEEIILATDGYKELLPTFKETEERLKLQIDEDSLCVDTLRGTKGIKPGNLSFDDRTYIRFSI